ncbi:prepilin-type N-terminal cleavage/methylation domain-containing protein [Parelusimicrobium proximum]|uniref:prepilin-type N-terminal cleavage/methylation domain-containing protein n=1 Tax=Parelusimicrobium proximum TaxID=3228953 RepID=UPI003D180252
MKKGFTLVELLAVVLIIAILAAIALPQYTGAVDKARYTQLIIYAKAVKDAEEIYYMENDEYTNNMKNLVIGMPANGTFISENRCVSFDNGDKVCAGMTYTYAVMLKDSLKVSYVAGYDNAASNYEGRICQAGEQTARAGRVCMSMGGTFRNAGTGCITGGICDQYTLP